MKTIVSGRAWIPDREDRARQQHLKVDLARIAVVANRIAQQVAAVFESDVGHREGPVPKLLPSGIRGLCQGVALERPDEHDEARTLRRSRGSARLDAGGKRGSDTDGDDSRAAKERWGLTHRLFTRQPRG